MKIMEAVSGFIVLEIHAADIGLRARYRRGHRGQQSRWFTASTRISVKKNRPALDFQLTTGSQFSGSCGNR
jgi:hypothetical protein